MDDLWKNRDLIVNMFKKVLLAIRNQIEVTSLMIFSGVYFMIGVFNWIYKDPTFTYTFFNLVLNNNYIFAISLAMGLLFSVRRNYLRVSNNNLSKVYSKTAFLVGMDFVFMLLGVLASQMVLLTFTYSQDYHLQLIAGSFAIATIGVNLFRKMFLGLLSSRIPLR